MKLKPFIGIVIFILLVWLWPNLVHEPLHWVALKLQGINSTINFHFGFPAQPTITPMSVPGTVQGSLFYLLFPSIISYLILIAILFHQIIKSRSTIIFHIIFPIYLVFDLVNNISRYTNPYSDFRWLMFFPSWVPILLIICTVAMGLIILSLAFSQKQYILEPTQSVVRG